jgi:hypothetical protein
MFTIGGSDLKSAKGKGYMKQTNSTNHDQPAYMIIR